MSRAPVSRPDGSEHEIRRLLQSLYERYGTDFRDYALSSITRRVAACMREEQLRDVEQYRERLVRDTECMERFLRAVTVHTTTMFRDASFYRAFRADVIPLLRSLPFLKIWHAGCSTGEEVYSLAVLLEEEGLRQRARVYATDITETALQRAREGIVPSAAIRQYTHNYIRAGGTGSFSDYYTASGGKAILRRFLRENVVFARHDLVADGAFNTFDCVICRNVLIYFNEKLAERVRGLLDESLIPGGVLGLGPHETLRLTRYEKQYQPLDPNAQLYRKSR